MKDVFIKPITGMYQWHNKSMDAWKASTIQSAVERLDDPAVKSASERFLAAVIEVRADFLAAGGTEPQFNVLAVAVFYGYFDPPAPRP